MSHEIDTTRVAAGAMFSVRETPWHRLGTVLVTPPTVEEGLKIAGLDFEVVKVPTYRRVSGIPGIVGGPEYQQNELAFSTVRTDTNAELGMVGPDYTPLQNRDAFKILQPMIDSGLAQLETAGSLRGGQDVWVQSKFDVSKFGPIVREVFTDEVVPFALFRNNHAGRMKVRVQLTPQRVVCANTLGMADSRGESGLDRMIEVKHTKEVEAKVIEAMQQLWGGIIERYEVVAKQYRTLKGFYLDEALFRDLVLNVVAPDPRDNPKFNPEEKRAELVIERAEAKRLALTKSWTHGTGHTGDHSAWEAYNGTVEELDHDEVLWPVRGGVWRTQALLDGRLGEMKQDVLNGLVAAADRN